MAQQFSGMILDVDGTLVDSNDAHARAWVEALAEAGYGVPFESVRRLIGMGGDHLLPAVAQIEADSEMGQRIDHRRGEIFAQSYLDQIAAFPRTRELLEAIKQRGLKLVVASSAKPEELTPLLDRTGAHALVEQTTSSGEAKQSKPSPDIVSVALGKLGNDPARTVMLGDTPYDIEAAGRAGIATIALRCGGWADADLAGALAIYDDPADLLDNLDQVL